jgi:hypothetical protein
MQRWRLNRTTYWSTEAAGPRLQLGVAGIGGREDGIAEPGDAGRVEGLLSVDQESGDRVAVGIVCIDWGRKLRLIEQTLESKWRSEPSCAPAEART